ncbi:MAG TPA: DNA polymerase III subunit delta [Cryomorphaceae bacterium]|nr:DNA polymerase III subunit delta [Cryomorphaceae bacterium]
MGAYSFESIAKDLKAGKYAPVYFFAGEEPFYAQQLLQLIEKGILDESERSFNQTVLYGKETNMLQILEEAKRFPMMSERIVVVVKEAQHLKAVDWELLAGYLERPQPSTVLAFGHMHKKLDKRSKAGKAIKANSVFLESDPLRDYQVMPWLEKELGAKGFRCSSNVVAAMAEQVGTDLSRLHKEVEKLDVAMGDQRDLSADDIERHIGISKDYNNFELVAAIAERNIAKAFKIVHYFSKNPKDHPVQMTTGILFNFVNNLLQYHSMNGKSEKSIASALKIHPYFLKQFAQASGHYNGAHALVMLEELLIFDRKCKGMIPSSANEYEHLREWLIKCVL